MSIQEVHIKILREQVADLTKENLQLQKQLSAWPRRALLHALQIRESLKKCNP